MRKDIFVIWKSASSQEPKEGGSRGRITVRDTRGNVNIGVDRCDKKGCCVHSQRKYLRL